EKDVIHALIERADSLKAHGKIVTACINTGDLVYNGKYGNEWKRFLAEVRPLSQRVPYFPITGNHEQSQDTLALANWHAATGLPISGDRLYYCFDSADGWMRFIAL